MLIESAFYKLPEILANATEEERPLEYTITAYLVMAIQAEFNARNVRDPWTLIRLEKRYEPHASRQHIPRCDLYVGPPEAQCTKSPGLQNMSSGENVDVKWGPETMKPEIADYASYLHNWIELKNYGIVTGSSPGVRNAGKVLRDILRVVLGPKTPINPADMPAGRYVLVVTCGHPSKCFAFSRRDGSMREWLLDLFDFDRTTFSLTVDLSEEPESLLKEVLKTRAKQMSVQAKGQKFSFQPLTSGSGFPGFYGVLMRVLSLNIKLEDVDVTVDLTQTGWDYKIHAPLSHVRDFVFGK